VHHSAAGLDEECNPDLAGRQSQGCLGASQDPVDQVDLVRVDHFRHDDAVEGELVGPGCLRAKPPQQRVEMVDTPVQVKRGGTIEAEASGSYRLVPQATQRLFGNGRRPGRRRLAWRDCILSVEHHEGRLSRARQVVLHRLSWETEAFREVRRSKREPRKLPRHDTGVPSEGLLCEGRVCGRHGEMSMLAPVAER
jgi:hypothetical protein